MLGSGPILKRIHTSGSLDFKESNHMNSLQRVLWKAGVITRVNFNLEPHYKKVFLFERKSLLPKVFFFYDFQHEMNDLLDDKEQIKQANLES